MLRRKYAELSLNDLCGRETAARVALWNDPLGDRHGATEVLLEYVRQQTVRRHLDVHRPSTWVRFAPYPHRIWLRWVATASLAPVHVTIYTYIYKWLIELNFTSHSTQNVSFRRRSFQPISWRGTGVIKSNVVIILHLNNTLGCSDSVKCCLCAAC